MIPQEHTAKVNRALRDSFGVTDFEDIRQMTKGNRTSLVYRIVVRGQAYLLRLILRTDDATRHYANMRIAAEAGLAPRVHYASVEDKVSITDFIEAVPLRASDALTRVPQALRAVHALPAFAAIPHHINTSCTYLLNRPAIEGFLEKFRAARLLPEDQADELFGAYARLDAACPRDAADMVSSHNDLFKPDNMLYDGARIWFIDWEAAFWNDRYADLAVVANMLVSNDAEARTYLEAYFGQPPDAYQLARLYVMQQVAHVFYAIGFLFIGSEGKPVDYSDAVPDYREFQERFWNGEVELKDRATKIAFARLHLEELLRNTRGARFQEALAELILA